MIRILNMLMLLKKMNSSKDFFSITTKNDATVASKATEALETELRRCGNHRQYETRRP